MKEEYPPDMFLAEHVAWCRGERDSMIRELTKYKERTFSVRERKVGKPLTHGATTHIAYLKSAIQHLDGFIAASSPLSRQQRSQPTPDGPMP
jgi:hypothetical protein